MVKEDRQGKKKRKKMRQLMIEIFFSETTLNSYLMALQRLGGKA